MLECKERVWLLCRSRRDARMAAQIRGPMEVASRFSSVIMLSCSTQYTVFHPLFPPGSSPDVGNWTSWSWMGPSRTAAGSCSYGSSVTYQWLCFVQRPRVMSAGPGGDGRRPSLEEALRSTKIASSISDFLVSSWIFHSMDSSYHTLGPLGCPDH